MTEPDISKLPKWAQQRIRKLEQDVEYWKGRASAGPENSNTFVRNYDNLDKPLGDFPSIAFGNSGGKDHRIEARLLTDGHTVEVRTNWRGMIIEPASSNVVRVREAEW